MNSRLAARTVQKVGSASTGICDLMIPQICLAEDAPGQVQPYVLADDNRQYNVCQNCFHRLIASGRWVLQPAAAKTV